MKGWSHTLASKGIELEKVVITHWGAAWISDIVGCFKCIAGETGLIPIINGESLAQTGTPTTWVLPEAVWCIVSVLGACSVNMLGGSDKT